jgi:hypothetical protein
MKLLRLFLIVSTAAIAFAQADIPAGTLLPIMLHSSINNRKSKPGDLLKARLMQDVPLGDAGYIPAGSRLLGHVVDVSPSNVSFVFDQISVHNHPEELRTSLRAIASMMEIHDAQLPANGNGPDHGTSDLDWVTKQVGGDIVYGRRGGNVMSHSDVVGHSLLGGGILAVPIDLPGSQCPVSSDRDVPQAMWLFSASACGAYGYPDVEIARAGESKPMGTIVLTSPKKINIRSGSGLLLSVQGE